MSENVQSPEQRDFIKSYNARRRWARFSIFTLTAACVITLISRVLKRSDEQLWTAIGILFLLYIYCNWIRAQCPRCNRYIGFSRWAQEGLPRGLLCDMETTCADALDKP